MCFADYLICRIATMGSLFKTCICSSIIPGTTFRHNGGCVIRTLEIPLSGWKHITHAEYSAATKRSLLSEICVILTNVMLRKGQQALYISEQTLYKFVRKNCWDLNPTICERKKNIQISFFFFFLEKHRPSLEGLFQPRAKKLIVGVSSFRHPIISILASVEKQHYRQRLAPLPPDWRCSCGRCSARSIRAGRLSRSPTSPPGPRTGKTGTPSSIPGRRWSPSQSRRRWNSRSASCRIISYNDWRSQRLVYIVPCRFLKFWGNECNDIKHYFDKLRLSLNDN